MLLFSARNQARGFTVLETLIILTIAGVVAAIAAPNLMGFLNRNKVYDALDQVRGALQEVQREAMRSGKSCVVTINTTNRSITSPCLVTGTRTMPDGVAIATNLSGTPPTIQFSFRGNTTTSGTIVVFSSDNATNQKGCFVISNGLGIMRTGDYTGSTASVSASNCTTTQ
jgi:type II secretory pathway pseudopilin PulG